jgi:hypothetical protein
MCLRGNMRRQIIEYRQPASRHAIQRLQILSREDQGPELIHLK